MSGMGPGCASYGGAKGIMPMSEQMIPGRSPGTTKGTLARPGAPAPKTKYKPRPGGSVKPRPGK